MNTTTTPQHKLVYFGSSSLSAQVLAYLLDKEKSSIEITAVVTQPARLNVHTHQADTPVASLAQKRGLRLIRPAKARDALDEIRSLQPDVGLLFAYGQILPPGLIELFPHGIVNIHPSLLPRHRGPSPIEATILNGDTQAGTSIMLIDEQMDAGPILEQSSFPISDTISKEDLTQKLMQASERLLLPTLSAYLTGDLKPRPQEDNSATYCKLIRKDDGKVDLTVVSADWLLRAIRAYSDWPGVTVELPEHEDRLRIITAIQTDTDGAKPGVYRDGKRLIIATRDGAIEATRVQLPGKSVLEARDAVNGLRLSPLVE